MLKVFNISRVRVFYCCFMQTPEKNISSNTLVTKENSVVTGDKKKTTTN